MRIGEHDAHDLLIERVPLHETVRQALLIGRFLHAVPQLPDARGEVLAAVGDRGEIPRRARHIPRLLEALGGDQHAVDEGPRRHFAELLEHGVGAGSGADQDAGSQGPEAVEVRVVAEAVAEPARTLGNLMEEAVEAAGPRGPRGCPLDLAAPVRQRGAQRVEAQAAAPLHVEAAHADHLRERAAG
jgi:hypothetical protein